MTKSEVLALIPARGGSKSVPRKNLLEIAGKPMLAYSIGHALECPSITRTVVSTDDDEIAEVRAPFRGGGAVPAPRRGRDGHRHRSASVSPRTLVLAGARLHARLDRSPASHRTRA